VGIAAEAGAGDDREGKEVMNSFQKLSNREEETYREELASVRGEFEGRCERDLRAWQTLLDAGVIFDMEQWFAEEARSLISSGELVEPEVVNPLTEPTPSWFKRLTEGSVWDRIAYLLGSFIALPVTILMMLYAFFEDQENKK
jgi:hypothetical protein